MIEDSLEIWRTLMERGTSHMGQAEYTRAEEYFKRAVRIARQLNVPLVKAFSLRLLATVQIKQGKSETAERSFREALQICEEVANFKGMSEALAGLASVAVEKNNFEEAAYFYNKSILVYPQESSPLRLAMLYSDLGQVYSALEQWPDAQKTYMVAIELCESYGYKKGAGELNVLLGEAYYREGKKEEALLSILQACKLFAQIDDNSSLVNVLQYYAFIQYEIQQYELAREALHRAAVLLIHQEDWEGLSEGLYFMMKILQSLGFLDEAEEYLKLSIRYCVDQENSLANRLLSLGKLLIQKEEYSQGKENLLKAADIFELLGDDLRLGECYESLAIIAGYLGDEEEKEYYQKESKRTIAGYHAHSLNAIIRLAEYYEGRRQYFDALRCYWQGIEIARDLGFEIDDLERSVQRVSRKVRQKRNRFHF